MDLLLTVMNYATTIFGKPAYAGLLVGFILFLIGKFAIRFYSGHSKIGGSWYCDVDCDSDDMDLLFFHHFIFRRPLRKFSCCVRCHPMPEESQEED
jgi:hypothetical protein